MIEEQFGDITLIHTDCMDYMATLPDKAFDLAIVDPPYGIGQNWKKDKFAKFKNHNNNFNDSSPAESYFKELFRISKNQIIWGCNYYWNFLPPTNNLIFWDKLNDPKKQFGSAGELAWVSFTKYPLLKYEFIWTGCVTCEKIIRIHPHQKPVKLYKQCLMDFATKGQTILDTHFGSLSLGVACHEMGFELTACELDKDYYNDGRKRLINHQKQQNLF